MYGAPLLFYALYVYLWAPEQFLRMILQIKVY